MTSATPDVSAWGAIRQRYDDVLWVDHRVALEGAALFRVGFGVYVLWTGACPRVRWLASWPDALYAPPPGLPALWGGFPSAATATAVEVGCIVFVALMTLGWRTPWTSAAAGITAIVGNSMVFSTGKIDHTIFVWLVPLVMAWSGWGERLSLDARRRPVTPRTHTPGPPVAALTMLLGVGFLTAALPKLAGGWLDPSTQAAQRFFRADQALLDRTHLLADAANALSWPWLWELADIATVALELAVPCAVLSPRLFRRLLAPLAVFHLVNLLVLNISFSATVVIYLLISLPAVDRRPLLVLCGHAERWWPAIVGATVIGVVGVLYRAPVARVLVVDVAGAPPLWRDVVVMAPLVAVVVGLNLGRRSQRVESQSRPSAGWQVGHQ